MPLKHIWRNSSNAAEQGLRLLLTVSALIQKEMCNVVATTGFLCEVFAIAFYIVNAKFWENSENTSS